VALLICDTFFGCESYRCTTVDGFDFVAALVLVD
jgi:hypothetical protein